MRHSKRQKLTADDVNRALHIHNVDVRWLCERAGTAVRDPPDRGGCVVVEAGLCIAAVRLWRTRTAPVSPAAGRRCRWDRRLLRRGRGARLHGAHQGAAAAHPARTDIHQYVLFLCCFPGLRPALTSRATVAAAAAAGHWLAIEGVQPAIPQNPLPQGTLPRSRGSTERPATAEALRGRPARVCRGGAVACGGVWGGHSGDSSVGQSVLAGSVQRRRGCRWRQHLGRARRPGRGRRWCDGRPGQGAKTDFSQPVCAPVSLTPPCFFCCCCWVVGGSPWSSMSCHARCRPTTKRSRRLSCGRTRPPASTRTAACAPTRPCTSSCRTLCSSLRTR